MRGVFGVFEVARAIARHEAWNEHVNCIVPDEGLLFGVPNKTFQQQPSH